MKSPKVMQETTEDEWEAEGGLVLTVCEVCGKIVWMLYHECKEENVEGH